MKKGGGDDKNVLITPLPTLPGYKVVDAKGFVMGSSLEFVPADRVLYAFFASIVNPRARHELYSSIFRSLRHDALLRLSENARKIGANAVLGVRLRVWRAGYGMYEAYAYGTAVEVKRL